MDEDDNGKFRLEKVNIAKFCNILKSFIYKNKSLEDISIHEIYQNKILISKNYFIEYMSLADNGLKWINNVYMYICIRVK